MLDYLYTKAFDCGQDVDDQDEPSIIKQMLEILAVYVLGDKYDIPGLRKYCRTLFEELESKAQSSCKSHSSLPTLFTSSVHYASKIFHLFDTTLEMSQLLNPPSQP